MSLPPCNHYNAAILNIPYFCWHIMYKVVVIVEIRVLASGLLKCDGKSL